MKIGDKVKIHPDHKTDILADNLSNVEEGDILEKRGNEIEDLINSDAIFIIKNIEDGMAELRPENKKWSIYGLHEENDLIFLDRTIFEKDRLVFN